MGETELPGPGKTRPVYRVIYLDEGLRGAIKARREVLGQTVQQFMAELSMELGPLVRALTELGLSGRPEGGRRPARLPLPAPLLEELRRASGQTGLPANRLLLLCLARSAGRKRRRPGTRAAGPGKRGKPTRTGDRAGESARRRGRGKKTAASAQAPGTASPELMEE
jgi:hypothetical protein